LVLRLFLTVWLAAFAIQSTDLLALVVPDTCVEDASGSGSDQCPQNCARCVCCARLSVGILQALSGDPVDFAGEFVALTPIPSLTDAVPRGILHIPKTA
jgi:hypothetical protein